MTTEQIKDVLDKHVKWLNNEDGGEKADLRWADLSKANLSGADLNEADIDFSCWPLWCGSLGVKVDVKIVRQLAFHLCAVECDDKEWLVLRKLLLPLANKFHRVGNDVKALEE